MTFIVSFGIILLLLICSLVYTSRLFFVVKLLCFPVFLGLSYMVYDHYTYYLGAPVEKDLPDEFAYRHHMLETETILVWIKEDRGERLYLIPYDRELAKKLEEAKEMQEQGGNPSVTATDDVDGQRGWQIEDANPEAGEPETK